MDSKTVAAWASGRRPRHYAYEIMEERKVMDRAALWRAVPSGYLGMVESHVKAGREMDRSDVRRHSFAILKMRNKAEMIRALHAVPEKYRGKVKRMVPRIYRLYS